MWYGMDISFEMPGFEIRVRFDLSNTKVMKVLVKESDAGDGIWVWKSSQESYWMWVSLEEEVL